MIDKNFKPYLIEINHAPSFNTDSPLDEKIKGQVIYDTLNLLGLSQKRKKNYKQVLKLKQDLRRFTTKKLQLPISVKDKLRREFDDLRNQYESLNRGMFEMIYPILDEITLERKEDEMRKYSILQSFAQMDFNKKQGNIKYTRKISEK